VGRRCEAAPDSVAGGLGLARCLALTRLAPVLPAESFQQLDQFGANGRVINGGKNAQQLSRLLGLLQTARLLLVLVPRKRLSVP